VEPARAAGAGVAPGVVAADTVVVAAGAGVVVAGAGVEVAADAEVVVVRAAAVGGAVALGVVTWVARAAVGTDVAVTATDVATAAH
jgi:hypothetical protein